MKIQRPTMVGFVMFMVMPDFNPNNRQIKNLAYSGVVNQKRCGFFDPSKLVCITESKPIGLFSLGIHLAQAQLHKTHDQIQTPLEQDVELL
jgi:hypothetical protein